jgi:hypothetical protein
VYGRLGANQLGSCRYERKLSVDAGNACRKEAVGREQREEVTLARGPAQLGQGEREGGAVG